MPRNEKLMQTVAGRTMSNIRSKQSETTIHFDDGSTLQMAFFALQQNALGPELDALSLGEFPSCLPQMPASESQ